MLASHVLSGRVSIKDRQILECYLSKSYSCLETVYLFRFYSEHLSFRIPICPLHGAYIYVYTHFINQNIYVYLYCILK